MNEAIASIVKTYVQGIDLADKVSGLVRPVTLKVGDSNKTYPVAWDVSHADCIKGKYNDLMPNSKYKSIVYFEDQGTTFLDRVGTSQYFESRLRLVGWINTKKSPAMDCPAPLSSQMIMQIVECLPTKTVNVDPFHTMFFKIDSEVIKSNAIFSAYTYDEQMSQYLFYPYDYFALNITVKYAHADNC